MQMICSSSTIRTSCQTVFLAFALVLSTAVTVHAAGIVVNSLDDHLIHPCATTGMGTCTLSDAITFANSNAGADRITFSVSGTITLLAPLLIYGDLTIDGTGQTIIVSGNNAVKVMGNNDSRLTLDTLTIANGATDSGGGGVSNGGTLNVNNSTFSGNFAAAGGGIYSSGTLNVTNSTFKDNSGDASDGAGGGILTLGTAQVTNSTFWGNFAGGYGGGGIYSEGRLIVTNSTFTANSTGITNGGDSTAAVFRNSIIAGSSDINCQGSLTDGGHNLDDGTSCGLSATTGSLNSTNPQLDPSGPQDNGGPTLTIGLLPASPAINAGDQTVCAMAPVNNRDQRSFVRPGHGSSNCSIGAYEADAIAPELCIGDCDGSGMVAINELITGVDIALGSLPLNACPAFENAQDMVDVAQLIKGVNNALNGCGVG